MYIIVGLGNPGKRYENTKHNVGFITLDLLAERHSIKLNKIKHKALVGDGNICGHKVILVKPQTYMNLSGNSVKEVMNFYKADISKLLVVYDDVDIPIGRIRIRNGGSAGTHNGMRSIIYDLQEDNFPRVRIGIGGERKMDLADYVTGGFRKEDIKTVEESIAQAADALESIVAKGIVYGMNEYNANRENNEKESDQKDNIKDV